MAAGLPIEIGDLLVAKRRKNLNAGAEKRTMRPVAAGQDVKTVNLALQGGGAHGAFAWGVLDRLLEERRIAFEGITASSAGAMNAAVLAYGLAVGGPRGAREALADFWRGISESGRFSLLQPSPFDRFTHNHSLEHSPAFLAFDLVTRLFSPYQFNPMNHNPLRDVLERTVDFARLRESDCVKLFLSATNVCTGKVKVFENNEVTADSVLASACLPYIFQAVEIDGESYWDGGYMGNPALFPLIYNCNSSDIVIVHINPIERAAPPRTAAEILNRVNEISFNSSLMREMRAIAFVTRLIEDGQLDTAAVKRMLIHAIDEEAFMRDLTASSKFNTDWEFLTHLRDVGRDSADRWVEATYDSLKKQSSVDIRANYI
jgi:NTE family protein